jgi:predicted nuclease of restriction endonuclease-like (RecB) superfamily
MFKKTIEYGWSRRSQEDRIKSDLYSRQGQAITNFKEKLPVPRSNLAEETLKDPYNFDFLELTDEYKEHELEMGLIRHVEKFLVEPGQGFAFTGRQFYLQPDSTGKLWQKRISAQQILVKLETSNG